MEDIIFKYFPQLSPLQKAHFQQIFEIYKDWNEKINVVSRKDFENFYIHHVLHSLAIAKFIAFKKGSLVMDIGTGGGFPTIPLAIFFPDVNFLAVDSIQKKLKVVDAVIEELKLTNVKTYWGRAEHVPKQFDFIITRAVAPLDDLIRWGRGKIHPISFNDRHNGMIALKGGDLKEEIKTCGRSVKLTPISDYFTEDFFATKYIAYTKL